MKRLVSSIPWLQRHLSEWVLSSIPWLQRHLSEWVLSN